MAKNPAQAKPKEKAKSAPSKKTVKPVTGNSEKKLANLKPFQPGQSGNPNGRPKVVTDITARTRALSEKAVNKLDEMLDSDDVPAAAKVSVIKEILDRALGKSPQHVTVKDDRENLSIHELRERAARKAEELRSLAAELGIGFEPDPVPRKKGLSH